MKLIIQGNIKIKEEERNKKQKNENKILEKI